MIFLPARKLELENGLRKAIEHNQLILHYQPQIHLETRRIIGVEALIRWQHPKYGMISPAEFIPLAEETGLIVPIGKWVLQEACKQNKAWQNAGFKSMAIAVNVSARQLQDDTFVQVVEETLTQIDLAANAPRSGNHGKHYAKYRTLHDDFKSTQAVGN